MKVEEVKLRLREIEAAKDDWERAEGLEYRLWHDVLDAIAKDAENSHLLAWWALSSRDIDINGPWL